MTEQVILIQTLDDGSIDTLVLNLKGVRFSRVYISSVEITKHYSHSLFYEKLKSAEKEFEQSSYKAQAPDCFHLRYMSGFNAKELVTFNHVLKKYINGDVSSYEFPFGKKYHVHFTTLVIGWLCMAIVSVFTFFIPLFNSLIDYRFLACYLIVAYVISYLLSLWIYKPVAYVYSRKRILRSLVVAIFLVGQVATVYRLLNQSSHVIVGSVEYYYLSENIKASSQNEYGVYVRLNNGKLCFFREVSDVNGRLSFKEGTKVNCEFKLLMPGIQLLVSRQFIG